MFVYFGRHKCASRFVGGVLGKYYELLGLGCINLAYPEPRVIDWILRTYKQEPYLARATPYTNYIRKLLDKHGIDYRGFHLVRDPRDMIVSGYFSHRHSHPEKWLFQKQHFARLRELPLEAGLKEEIDYTGWLEFDDMLAWEKSRNIKEVRFEDLVADPLAVFSDVLEFGGITLNESLLSQVVEQNSFEKESGGRKRGEEDVTHHYRSGTPGDWKRYLSDENLDYFMSKYGDLLEKYGYE